MLVSVKGYYEAGKVILTEEPPVTEKTEVVVVFPSGEKGTEAKKRVLGSLEGKIRTPDDFNEPLDDLKDYM